MMEEKKLKSEIAFSFVTTKRLESNKNKCLSSLEITNKWCNLKLMIHFFFFHEKVDGVEETGHHLPMHEHKKHRGESYILKSS